MIWLRRLDPTHIYHQRRSYRCVPSSTKRAQTSSLARCARCCRQGRTPSLLCRSMIMFIPRMQQHIRCCWRAPACQQHVACRAPDSRLVGQPCRRHRQELTRHRLWQHPVNAKANTDQHTECCAAAQISPPKEPRKQDAGRSPTQRKVRSLLETHPSMQDPHSPWNPQAGCPLKHAKKPTDSTESKLRPIASVHIRMQEQASNQAHGSAREPVKSPALARQDTLTPKHQQTQNKRDRLVRHHTLFWIE